MFNFIQRFLLTKLEGHGINLSRDAATTGLTNKNDVLDLLARLRPQDNGHTLIRVGGPRDGGYLIPNDMEGLTELFSPGSNKLSNFEREAAEFWQIESYICDSIEEQPKDLSSYQDFTDAWVGPYTDGEKFISLAQWVEEKSESSGDLMLQMDIEGAEFLTLLAVPTSLMKRFRIIVIELHFLESLKNRWAFELLYTPFFNKILSDFDVVHLHPNNCCGLWRYGDIEYPRLIELTLHRKDRSQGLIPKVTSHNSLDEPCVQSLPDLSIQFQETEKQFKILWSPQ
jgi:hypothetical protein